MTLVKTTLVSGLVLLGLGLLAGCGGGDGNTVARVGDDKITLEDFQDFVERQNLAYRTADEEFEKKRQLLDSLISHTLLIQGGYEKGIEKSDDVAQILEANRDRFLLDALYEYHVGRKAEVTEAELRETYDDLEYQIHTYHILIHDPDTAQMVFERLKAGEDFEQLAYEYSKDPTAKRNRGDMGYYIRGTAPEEFEKVAFGLEAGEVTPPFETQYGWHIVKMIDKKPNDMREEYSRLRPTLREQLVQSKREQQMRVYFDSVRQKYEVKIDTLVADYVTNKRNVLYPPQVVERLPKYDFDDDQLDRDEKELVLATWDGGQMTLMQYLMSVRRWFPPEQRPAFDDYDSLSSIIYLMKRRDILVEEALKEKLDETEFFKNGMKKFERYTVAEIMRNDSIAQPDPPEEQEIRDYYDRNREEFLVPAQVHIFEILVSDEMLAQRLAREIKTLEQFQINAVQYTERAAMRVKRGDMGYIDNTKFPELYRAAKETPIGTVGGPIRFRGKYSLIWPVRWTDETYMDFLAVKEDIIERLSEQRRKDAVNEWLAQRREETDIEIYEDVIWETIDREFYAASGNGDQG